MMLGARTSHPQSVSGSSIFSSQRDEIFIVPVTTKKLRHLGERETVALPHADSFNEMRCYKYLAPTERTNKP
jgi:hypothetical protein